MHVGYALTYQFEGFGIVEQIESLLVWQTFMLGYQLDDASILVLEEYGIGLHGLQSDGFYEMQVLAEDGLRGDADLVVGLLPLQLIESLLTRISSL